MRIAIVGGSGWVGSHLVQRLAEKHAVTVLASKDPLIPFPDSVTHIRARVSRTIPFVDFIRDADAIVSLPGRLGSVDSLENPFDGVADSIVPQLILLETLADNELTPTVVFPSSHLVYKQTARCLYTANKKLIEDYLQIYSRAYGIPYVILRCATAYGPLQRRDSVVNFFIRRALEGKTIPVYVDVVHDRLAIVYIDDMVRALTWACERRRAYRYHVYPVLSSQLRVIDIASAVADLLGGEIEFTETPALVKSVGSGDLLITDDGPPDWIPIVPLKDGIMKTADWILN